LLVEDGLIVRKPRRRYGDSKDPKLRHGLEPGHPLRVMMEEMASELLGRTVKGIAAFFTIYGGGMKKHADKGIKGKIRLFWKVSVDGRPMPMDFVINGVHYKLMVESGALVGMTALGSGRLDLKRTHQYSAPGCLSATFVLDILVPLREQPAALLACAANAAELDHAPAALHALDELLQHADLRVLEADEHGAVFYNSLTFLLRYFEATCADMNVAQPEDLSKMEKAALARSMRGRSAWPKNAEHQVQRAVVHAMSSLERILDDACLTPEDKAKQVEEAQAEVERLKGVVQDAIGLGSTMQQAHDAVKAGAASKEQLEMVAKQQKGVGKMKRARTAVANGSASSAQQESVRKEVEGRAKMERARTAVAKGSASSEQQESVRKQNEGMTTGRAKMERARTAVAKGSASSEQQESVRKQNEGMTTGRAKMERARTAVAKGSASSEQQESVRKQNEGGTGAKKAAVKRFDEKHLGEIQDAVRKSEFGRLRAVMKSIGRGTGGKISLCLQRMIEAFQHGEGPADQLHRNALVRLQQQTESRTNTHSGSARKTAVLAYLANK